MQCGAPVSWPAELEPAQALKNPPCSCVLCGFPFRSLLVGDALGGRWWRLCGAGAHCWGRGDHSDAEWLEMVGQGGRRRIWQQWDHHRAGYSRSRTCPDPSQDKRLCHSRPAPAEGQWFWDCGEVLVQEMGRGLCPGVGSPVRWGWQQPPALLHEAPLAQLHTMSVPGRCLTLPFQHGVVWERCWDMSGAAPRASVMYPGSSPGRQWMGEVGHPGSRGKGLSSCPAGTARSPGPSPVALSCVDSPSSSRRHYQPLSGRQTIKSSLYMRKVMGISPCAAFYNVFLMTRDTCLSAEMPKVGFLLPAGK